MRSSALDVGPSKSVLHYTDDDLCDDIPDATSVLASGFETSNSLYIGNGRFEGLTIAEAYLCLQVAGAPLKTACKRLIRLLTSTTCGMRPLEYPHT